MAFGAYEKGDAELFFKRDDLLGKIALGCIGAAGRKIIHILFIGREKSVL